jgi:hypothetical protein
MTVLFVLCFLSMNSCKDSYNPVEGDADFWISDINTDSEYKPLTGIYSAVFVTGGVGGILVIRTKYEGTIDDFSAFDRACPYEYEKGRTIKVEWTKDDPVYATCPECKSKYNLIGRTVESGPSKYPLYTYECDYNGNDIHIY